VLLSKILAYLEQCDFKLLY